MTLTAMTNEMTAPVVIGAPGTGPALAPALKPMSPNQRAWARFKRNRIGYGSLWIMVALLIVSAFAELLSNDRPLVAHYNGQWSFPIFYNAPETTYGGDFATPTDWSDPFITQQFAKPGNWMLRTLNPHSATSTDYFQKAPNPAAPSAQNWLGTDSIGQDMIARLLYGFRVSILFGLALTAVGTVIAVTAGAVQGYFGGRIDLTMQRLIETLFSLDGLGLLSYESIVRRDYPVVLGSLYLFTLIGLGVKLVSDMLYVVVDPRVQFGSVAK